MLHDITQWRNYVRRSEAAASGHRAAEGAAEFVGL